MKQNIIIAVLELNHTEIVDSLDDPYDHMTLHCIFFEKKGLLSLHNYPCPLLLLQIVFCIFLVYIYKCVIP